MSDEQNVWAALAVLLKASPLGEDVYDYDTVPGMDDNDGSLPYAYAVLTVERRYVAPDRSGATSLAGYRAAVRFVGITAKNARMVSNWVAGALEITPGRGKRIAVGSHSTRLKFESAQDVEPGNGRYSGQLIYTL